MKKTIKYLVPTFLALPIVVLAAAEVDNSSYIGLIKIPVESDTFGGYINALYLLAVSLAAILAVLKLILAGVKYMLSDVVTNKSDAKNEIKGALVGLLIIIAAVVVLNEINPSITDNNVGFPEKVKNVKFEIRNPGITKTVGGETVDKVTSDLTAGLPSCAKSSGATRGGSGGTMVVTVDVSECPAADRQNILASFENTCEQKPGGSAASGGSGSNVVSCGIPLEETNRWSVNDYKTTSDSCWIDLGPIERLCTDIKLSDEYVTREGNVLTYNADKYCAEKHPDIELADCKEEVRDAFIHSDDIDPSGYLQNSFCENNAGKEAGSFKCELPTTILGPADAAAFAALLPPDWSGDTDDLEAACKQYYAAKGYKATMVNTKRTWTFGGSDYACVVYDSDN